jgi:hypothetical protein
VLGAAVLGAAVPAVSSAAGISDNLGLVMGRTFHSVGVNEAQRRHAISADAYLSISDDDVPAVRLVLDDGDGLAPVVSRGAAATDACAHSLVAPAFFFVCGKAAQSVAPKHVFENRAKRANSVDTGLGAQFQGVRWATARPRVAVKFVLTIRGAGDIRSLFGANRRLLKPVAVGGGRFLLNTIHKPLSFSVSLARRRKTN